MPSELLSTAAVPPAALAMPMLHTSRRTSMAPTRPRVQRQAVVGAPSSEHELICRRRCLASSSRAHTTSTSGAAPLDPRPTAVPCPFICSCSEVRGGRPAGSGGPRRRPARAARTPRAGPPPRLALAPALARPRRRAARQRCAAASPLSSESMKLWMANLC
jgi:hypothetical protein